MKKRNLGIALSYTYLIVNMVSGLFISSYLLRMLGDTEYGIYQSVSAFAAYLVMLEFGTGTVMSRNISLCRAKSESKGFKENYSTIWYMSLSLSLIIIAVSVIFYLNINRLYHKTMTPEQTVYAQKIFVIIVFYLIFSFLLETLKGFLIGVEEYTFSQIVNLIKTILRVLLLACIIYFFRYSVCIAVVDLVISVAMLIICFLFAYKKHGFAPRIKYFDKKILIDVLPLCLAMLLQTVVNQANASVDKFVISIQMSMQSVAIYSVAQYITNVFSSVTTVPISMFMPQVAKDISSGKDGIELTRTLIPPCRLTALSGGMILFGFFAVGKQFIHIVYGASKVDAWVYALIVLIPNFVVMTNGVIVNVLDVIKKRHIRSYILIITTAINIALTFWLISLWGIVGAVVATAISMIIGQILTMNIYYSKKIRIRILYLFKEAYRGLLIFMLIAGAASYFVASLIENEYISFLVGGIAFVILALTPIYLFGLNKDEKKLVNNYFNKLLDKRNSV